MKKYTERGAALVEFAIAFPLQLFITFAILQFILIAVASLMTSHAAHSAARAAIVGEDPARAAAIILTPLAGSTDAHNGNARKLLGPIVVPGWGELGDNGALLHPKSLRAAEKTHVRLNGSDDPLLPSASMFTLNNRQAYRDEERYYQEGLHARDEVAYTFGNNDSATAVVEFDYELIFPIVDGLYALFYRTEVDSSQRPGASVTTERTVFGDADIGYDATQRSDSYQWTYEPGVGAKDVPRVRKIGGRYHYVIAKESTLYRGFPLR